RPGVLATYLALVSAQQPRIEQEELATLGARLTLIRAITSASGFSGRTMDVGPYEREEIFLIEVDDQGRRCRIEIFAPHQLGEAVVRMYERYAEILPEGPERTHAASIARSMATNVGPLDLERYAECLAPDVDVFDRRLVGAGRARGSQQCLDGLRS